MAWEEVTPSIDDSGSWEEVKPEPVKTKEPTGFFKSIAKGFTEDSATGLAYKSLTGGKYTPQKESDFFTDKAGHFIGTVAGDMPTLTAGSIGGALAGGPAAFFTSPAAGMGLTELTKAHLRSQLGSGESPEDVGMAGLKGAALGTVMGPLSKIGTVAPRFAKATFPLEVAGTATVASGMEGKTPTPEDVALFTIPVLGMKGAQKLGQVGRSAVYSKPEAELFKIRQAAAEKAGIPATATTGKPVQSSLAPTPLDTAKAGAGSSIVDKRRRRNIVKDLEDKHKDLKNFQEMLIKEQDSEAQRLVIDEELPAAARLDEVQRKTIEDRVNALGSVEKVREVYSGDDNVSIYARELAANKFRTEATKVNAEAKPEAPSVQKLNKGALTAEEFKALEDTNVFAVEELERIKKLPGFKQREQYNRTFNIVPEVKQTSAEIEKARELASKVEAAAKARYNTLGGTNKLNPSKKQVSAMGEIEQELAALRKEMEGVTPDKITPELEAKMVALAEKVGNELPFGELLEPTERLRKFLEVNEEGEPILTLEDYMSRRDLVRQRLDAYYEKTGKQKKGLYRRRVPLKEAVEEIDAEHIPGEDLSPITDIGKPVKTRAQEIKADRESRAEAEDWEARLEAEGMPAELNFAREKVIKDYVEFLSSDKWNKEIHADSVKAKVDVEKELYNARNRLDSISEDRARYLLSRVYQHMPLTKAEAVEWFKTIEKVEAIADSKIRDKRMAFSRKAIASHYKGKPGHAKIANTILDTLKKQPTFELKIDPELKGVGGFYSLVDNMVTIKNPKSLAHEVAHWAFYNVLDSKDRAIYRQHFMNKFYDAEGKINPEAIKIDTTDRFNAVRSPAEAFAAKMADYTYDKVLTPAEKTLFAKIADWFRNVKDNLLKRTTNDYSGVSELFDKVLSKEERTGWNILEGEPDYVKRAYRDLVDVNAQHVTFDMLGFQQMYERLVELGETFRKAKMDDKGRKILAEIKGNDWGLAEAYSDQTILRADTATVKERIYRNLGPYVVSPVPFVKGTINERHVYNANLAEMYTGSMYDQHRTTIDNILLNLKNNSGDPKNIRKVIEKKIEGTDAEKQAASEVRQWLDGMKERYKVFMLNEYKENLSKKEYDVLTDIISGRSIDDVKAKNPKLDTKTLESIYAKYKEIDTWGLDNYIPNVEAGRFKVVVKATNVEGKNYKKLVAIGLSEKDAIRKATRYAEEHPEIHELEIDTDFKVSTDNITPITRKQYYAMMHSLAKKMEESIDGIDKGVAKNMAQATMKRKFKIKPTDSYSPFLEPRKDILLGEEDIFPVLKSYAYSLEKKMALDPVIEAIRGDLGKMNKWERDYILDYIEDVKGRYGTLDKVVDDLMEGVSSTRVAKALGIDVSAYRGYSRAISGARTLEANLKLGYRPVAAGVNFASGQLHTWVKRGLPMYMEGIKFLNTSEGRKLIQDIEPFLGTNIVDTGISITSKTPLWKPLGMFQKAEPYNREVSAAVAYVQAIKEGMTPEAAKMFAIRSNWAEQFTYNIANLPKIMRGPTGKLLTQFKPYLIKEIEFMKSLSAPEWARYFGMQLILGGPRAYMLTLKTLPILAGFAFWDDLEEWMNKEYPLLSRGVGGAPGLIDKDYAFDMSAAASFQFPTSTKDIAGPFISDLLGIKKNVIDPMFAFGPYSEDYQKTGNVAPILKHWLRLMKFTFAEGPNKNMLKDEDGNELYEVKDIIPLYLQSMAGVESLDLNMIRAEERILANRDERIGGHKTRIANEVAQVILNKKPITNDMRDMIKKYGVTSQTIINRAKQTKMTPRQRAIYNTEVRRRMEVMEMFPIDDPVSEPASQDYGYSE